MLARFLAASLLLFISDSLVQAADRPASRVLIIGIDGCRVDALKTAKIPHLQALIDGGAFSDATNIVGIRADAADTVSGPGWSNVLTGVWPDKHGVLNNKFAVMHYDLYPHFFAHLKEVFPQAKTYSYCVWPPIHEKIVSAADESLLFARQPQEESCAPADQRCAAQAVETLSHGDPDAMFVYFENVDDTGHRKGFHPTVPDYRQAIEGVDRHVGEVLDALRTRPHYAQENWLVLVATDHGGQGTDHAGGRKKPEINTVFLIVSSAGAAHGKIVGTTNQVDVVATALVHLGVPLKPQWKLDGHPVGLEPAVVPQGALGRQLIPRLVQRFWKRPDVASETGVYLRRLADVYDRLPVSADRFGLLMQAGFALAAQRSTDHNPVLENRAAILALAILFGHSDLEPFVGELLDPAARALASRAKRPVALRGRQDWPRHFLVSAALVLLSDESTSNRIGLVKEQLDSQSGGSGFSFADLLANRAGIRLATAAVRDEAAARVLQTRLAEGFDVDAFFPPADGLPEGIPAAEFESQYGGVGGPGCRAIVDEISRRIDALPKL